MLSCDLYGFEVCYRFNYDDTKKNHISLSYFNYDNGIFFVWEQRKVVCKFDQPSGYVPQFLLRSYNAKIFKDRVRVNRPIF